MVARKAGWVVSITLGCAIGIVIVVAGLRFRRGSQPSSETTTAGSAVVVAQPRTYQIGEVVYDGGFRNGWKDWGWGPHEIGDAGPARIRFSDFGGIVFQHDEMPSRFGAVAFRFRAPPSYGDFLYVSLKYRQMGEKAFPRVKVEARDTVDLADGWKEALVPWHAINPTSQPFDRVVIESRHAVGSDWVLIDKVVLAMLDARGEDDKLPTRHASLTIDCSKTATSISPLIYGIATGTEGLGETVHRVGGNPSTRHNWDLRGVWNTGSDWYFENVKGAETGLSDWIEQAHKSGVKMAVTVPTIGWVAKDTTSVAFPVSKFGPQRKQDPKRPEAGDGVRPDGTPIAPGPPSMTSIAAPPELIRQWITKIRQRDAERGARGVHMYILDNEPDLWNATHRDVHPDPVSYDELLDRTIRYGTAIRESDPEAVIAGPASWGWSGYFFSAKDMASGWHLQPDRRAHGGVPLLPWYLQSLAAHEKKTGVRILDVLDVHYYPQAKGVYKDAATDPDASALRLRSTRALWDPTYKDESWIGEHINLIPRLKDWVAQNYPGRGISIGEWSFGAEKHISGGLAVAEALGRFGQQGITSAYYWFDIPANTPAFNAFRAYRNFDGKGGRFLDWSIPTASESPAVSLFASRDDTSSHVVAIALNLDQVYAIQADIALASCGRVASRKVFTYGPREGNLAEENVPRDASPPGTVREFLRPSSIKVLDIVLAKP
jgi:hypothetical protein